MSYLKLNLPGISSLFNTVDEQNKLVTEAISTGSITVFSGLPGTGKTTLLHQLFKNLMANNAIYPIYLDYELGETRALRTADRVGLTALKHKQVYHYAPDNPFDIIQTALYAAQDKKRHLVVFIDSVDNMSATISEQDYPTAKLAVQLHKLSRSSEHPVTFIIIQHCDDKGKKLTGSRRWYQLIDNALFLSLAKDGSRRLSVKKTRDTVPANEITLSLTSQGFVLMPEKTLTAMLQDHLINFIDQKPWLKNLIRSTRKQK